MGGHDDFLCVHSAPVSDRCGTNQLPHQGVLIDVQTLGECREKLQWMELGLICKHDRTCRGEEERQMVSKFCAGPQLPQVLEGRLIGRKVLLCPVKSEGWIGLW